MFARDNKTAPHQSRKKREPTSAVELVETKYGDGVEAIADFRLDPRRQLTYSLVSQEVSSLSTASKSLLFRLPLIL